MTVWQWVGLNGPSWQHVPLALLLIAAVLFALDRGFLLAGFTVAVGLTHDLLVGLIRGVVAALYNQSMATGAAASTIDSMSAYVMTLVLLFLMVLLACLFLWLASAVPGAFWVRHGAMYFVLAALALILLDFVMVMQLIFTVEPADYPRGTLPVLPKLPEMLLFATAVVTITVIITDFGRAYSERRKQR